MSHRKSHFHFKVFVTQGLRVSGLGVSGLRVTVSSRDRSCKDSVMFQDHCGAFGQSVSIIRLFGSLNSSCHNLWKYISTSPVFIWNIKWESISFGLFLNSGNTKWKQTVWTENGETCFSLWTSFSWFLKNIWTFGWNATESFYRNV